MKKMKQNGKRILSWGISCVLAFVVWTALIQIIDVQAVGQHGTEIGFATFNIWFHELTGVHMTLYTLTDWMGLIPVLVCMSFAGLGFVQMIQRRSFFQVDYDLICLGIYYLAVIFGYLIFEMIPVNYRPILIEGRLEASYPSSTTLLVLSVMPTFVEQVYRRLENAAVKKVINIFVTSFSIFMVTGRLVSGVHWFTDIVGGGLLSAGLFFIYKAVVLSGGKEEH